MEWVDGNLGSKLTMKYPSIYLLGERAHGEVLSIAFGSHNRSLIRAPAELAPDGIEVVPLEMDLIPLYDADLEAHGDPKSVERLKQAIAEADALLVATPEHNRGIPTLKNAIDA